MKPTISDANLHTALAWSDEFDGDLSKWYQDDFVSNCPHRTGNKQLTVAGQIDTAQRWQKVPGRWAGLYNKYRDEVQTVTGGHLVMRGVAVNEPNPYRESFTDADGREHPYGDWMLYAPWLTTMGHTSVDGRLVGDPEKTTCIIKPGSVIEVRVNLSDQVIRACRWNHWLMPVSGNAYDEDVADVEVDAPEVECGRRIGNHFGQYALMKVVGGQAGDTPGGMVDLSQHGIDLRAGWHTFTTRWESDGSLRFYVDGVLVNEDARAVTVPMYLIMAFEFNSGVKAPKETPRAWENYATGPKKPVDVGLSAQSCILDVDLIDEHRVLVDYVRVFDIIGTPTQTEPSEPSPPPTDPVSPDIDLGDSIEQEIDDLADLYEDALERNTALNQVITNLRAKVADLTRREADLLAHQRTLTSQLDASNAAKDCLPVTAHSRQRLKNLLKAAGKTP